MKEMMADEQVDLGGGHQVRQVVLEYDGGSLNGLIILERLQNTCSSGLCVYR